MKNILRNISSENLGRVAYVHMQAFPNSVLTKFGHEAVRRYYLWQLTGPHDCIAVGSYSNDALTGFVFGGMFHGAMTGFLSNNRTFLLSRLITRPWLLVNPKTIDRIAVANRLLWKRKINTCARTHTPLHKSFSILSIAVSPAFQKNGVGRLLMDYAENTAREKGFIQMHLTVAKENCNAIMFYQSLGWKKESIDNWNGLMIKFL